MRLVARIEQPSVKQRKIIVRLSSDNLFMVLVSVSQEPSTLDKRLRNRYIADVEQHPGAPSLAVDPRVGKPFARLSDPLKVWS